MRIGKKNIIGIVSALTIGIAGCYTASTHETLTQTASKTVHVTQHAEVTKTAKESVAQTVTQVGQSLSATGHATAEYSAEATKKATATASATAKASATGDCWWFNQATVEKTLMTKAEKKAQATARSKATMLAKGNAEKQASSQAQEEAVAKAKDLATARAKTLATEKAQAALTTFESEAKVKAESEAQAQQANVPTLPSTRPDATSQQVALPSTGGGTTTEAPSDVALDITTSVTGYVPETGYGMWMANFVVAHNPGSGEAFMNLAIGDLVRVNGNRYKVVDKFRAYGPPETYPQSTRELTYKDFYDTSIYRAPLMFDGRMTLQTCADNGLKSVWTWKLDYA